MSDSKSKPTHPAPANLNIDNIVEQLREIRIESLKQRQRLDKPPKLPSRKALTHIIEGLSAALFPNRLGHPDLADQDMEDYVALTLNTHLQELKKQLRHEIAFETNQNSDCTTIIQLASERIAQFANQLPHIRKMLDTDIQAAYEGDPAAGSQEEVLICYPGIQAMIHHRIAHVLYHLGARLVARVISEIAHSTTGIDIHPGAQIDERFFIDHGTGVVIGETAIIGKNVRVYQAVTLGAVRFPKNDDGTLVKGNLRHPIVEDDVVIYAGATILGRITLGKGTIIGGNVWVTHSLAPGSLITQEKPE